MATWPTVTSVDRLRKAYARLGRKRVLGIEFLGEDWEVYETREALAYIEQYGGTFEGFVFVHGEDRFRILAEGRVSLSFGAIREARAEEVARRRDGCADRRGLRADLEREAARCDLPRALRLARSDARAPPLRRTA